MANSTFLEFQDKDNSGLLDKCDELASVPEQKTCPLCQKNVNYIAPDWKTKDVDEPWLNEKTCKYQTTIITNERSLIPSANATTEEGDEHVGNIFETHETEAIDGILVYFEKDNSESNIESLKDVIEYEKYDLDIRTNSKVKLLYSIPYEYIASLGDAPEDDEDEEDEEDTPQGKITVTYNGSELNSNVLRVRKALNLYGTYLDVYRATEKINIIFENENRLFYLKRYGDNGFFGRGVLENIIKDIDRFLNRKGYILRGGAAWGINKDIINEIEFTFTGEYRLKKIVIITRDCGNKRITFGSKKIRSLTRKGNFKDKTAMAYLAKIDEMVSDLTAREPPVWTDFIVEHTYPEVILAENWPYGGDYSTGGSCIGEALLAESKQLGQDILDIDFSLSDSILYAFNKKACKEDLAALRQESVKLNLVYDPVQKDTTKISVLAKEQAYKQLELDGEVFIAACFKMLDGGDEKGSSSSTLGEMFKSVFHRLKLCGLNDLMVDSTNCLLAGLSFEKALSSIIKSALQNMSIQNFGEVMNLLSAGHAGRIRARVRQKLNSGDIFSEESTNQRISDYIEKGVDPGLILDTEPWNNRDFLKQLKQAYSDSVNGLKDKTDGLSSKPFNNETRTLAQRYETNRNSLKDSNGLIIELYIETILEEYDDDLFSVLEVLNRFPGSQLVAKALLLADCPQPPIFSPSVLDFIRDIELPFCKGIDDITFPVLRNPFAWIPEKNDITGAMTVALKLGLQQALVSVLTRLMVKICNLLGSTLCQTIKSTGQILGNFADVNNRTAIIDTIRDSICGPEARAQDIENTVIEMFEKLGLGAAALADTEKLLEFTGDMSSSLTRGELMNLFLGNPTTESLRVVRQIIEDDYPEYEDALPSEDAAEDFFRGMGNLLPAEDRNSMQDFLDGLPDDDKLPANPSLCAAPEDLENFCLYRQNLLSDRATEEQTKLICENYQDELAEKLDDITNALQQGPSNMIVSALPQIISDPGCDNGLIPFEPAAVTNAINKSMDFTLKQIFIEFSTDMLGNGPGEKNWGLINMILSDTMGNPLTAHHRKAFNSENYVDFVTNTADSAEQIGQFPLYVAEWMREQLESLNTTFDTNNNFRDKRTITKTFRELNLDLYGGVDVIALPDFGYNTRVVVKYETQTVDFIREGRKENPDLELEFRDNNKGKVEFEDSTYLYGFNLNLFLSELKEEKTEEGDFMVRNIPADTARINITNVLNFSADISSADKNSMSKEDKDAYKESKGKKTPSIQKERAFEFVAIDDTFDLITLTDFPNFQQSFYIKQDYIPQLVLFNEILTQQGYTGSIDQLKTFHDSALGSIFQGIISEIQDNENAFLYGAKYDDLSETDAEYVVQEGQTDSTAGTLYSDATINGESIANDDAILGISRSQYEDRENTRVFYLDPATFGGNYINPPVYIKPLQNEGWLGLVDVMFPELSPCKPSKTDLIDFGEISEQVQETYNNMPMDERLKSDPDCIVELPYNRILERMGAAGIQGVITAACRIFSSVHFIKTIATFTTFKPDFDNVYSSLYPQYIVESMEIALKDAQAAGWEALNPFKDEEFWYAFLEQAVQTYGRLVDQGAIIDPPESVLQALFRINDMQAGYGFPSREDWKASQDLGSDLGKAAAAGQIGSRIPVPGAGPAAAIKVFADNFETYKQHKERLNFEAVKVTEDDAKIVLKEMVKIELQYMSDKFLENLESLNLTPKYTDIDYFILTQFTNGGIDLDLDKEIIAIEEEEPTGPSYGITSDVASHVHTYQVDAEGNGWAYEAYHPTESRIHHKHQIINWEIQPSQSDCYPDCKQIYGNEGVGPHIHNISRMIVPIGDVESYGYLPDIESTEPFIIEKYVKIDGIKYSVEDGDYIIKLNEPTLNISDVFPGTLEIVYALGSISQEASRAAATRTESTDEPVGIKGELGVRHGLQFSAFVDGQKFEITSVEIDALDYEIQAFVPVQANSKELLCLLKMLKEDQKFRLTSRYIIPVNKLLSTAAIYNDMAFLPSIGEKTVDTGDYEGAGFTTKPGMKITFIDGAPDYSDSKSGWASADDRVPGFFSGMFVREWDYWDQVLLRNSKSRIKALFKNFYNSRDFQENFDSMFSFDPISFAIGELKGNLRPRTPDAILPKWRKKRLRSNPFDSKGTLCKK